MTPKLNCRSKPGIFKCKIKIVIFFLWESISGHRINLEICGSFLACNYNEGLWIQTEKYHPQTARIIPWKRSLMSRQLFGREWKEHYARPQLFLGGFLSTKMLFVKLDHLTMFSGEKEQPSTIHLFHWFQHARALLVGSARRFANWGPYSTNPNLCHIHLSFLLIPPQMVFFSGQQIPQQFHKIPEPESREIFLVIFLGGSP